MERGLTLIEILAVLAVTAVLAGLLGGSLETLVTSSRASATLNSFATVLATARSTAIVFGTSVRVCPGRDGQCASRNTWHQGALAFTDLDNDRVVDADERLIASHPGFTRGIMRWRSFRNRTDLVFAPTGLTDWLNGSFLYCPDSGEARHARMLIINTAGRIRHAMDRNRDGVREDASGRPLACSH
jgi:type IV fimbrial biogenesis protein FimT